MVKAACHGEAGLKPTKARPRPAFLSAHHRAAECNPAHDSTSHPFLCPHMLGTHALHEAQGLTGGWEHALLHVSLRHHGWL